MPEFFEQELNTKYRRQPFEPIVALLLIIVNYRWYDPIVKITLNPHEPCGFIAQQPLPPKDIEDIEMLHRLYRVGQVVWRIEMPVSSLSR